MHDLPDKALPHLFNLARSYLKELSRSKAYKKALRAPDHLQAAVDLVACELYAIGVQDGYEMGERNQAKQAGHIGSIAYERVG